MSTLSSDAETTVKDAAALLRSALERGQLDSIDPVELQALFSATLKAYVAMREEGVEFLPLPKEAPGEAVVTATEGLVTASAILQAIDVEVFELGMWRSWGKI